MPRLCFLCLLFACQLVSMQALRADPGVAILASSRQALATLSAHVEGSEALLQQAKGVLVFPELVKMGFAVSGQYGEGVLLIADLPVAYYASAGARFGLQLGGQFKSEVIVFLSDDALQAFRQSRGWEVGVDAEITLIQASQEEGMESLAGQHPVVGFIFSEQGLLENLTLEGTRIARVAR